MAGMGVGVISKARGTERFISRLVNRPLDVPATTPGGRFVANQSCGHVIALSGFCPRPDIRLTGRSRCPRGSGYTCYCLVYFLSVSRGFLFCLLATPLCVFAPRCRCPRLGRIFRIFRIGKSLIFICLLVCQSLKNRKKKKKKSKRSSRRARSRGRGRGRSPGGAGTAACLATPPESVREKMAVCSTLQSCAVT